MAKATKRSRAGRRLERKDEAWFPLRRPALLAALGLAGWAPTGAADFPSTLNLSNLDGTNGFRLAGVTASDYSGISVSNAGDVNGDGLGDLLIGADGADLNGTRSGASYVVFGRNTGQTGPFPTSLNLSSLDGRNGFRLDGVAFLNFSGRAVSSAGDVNGDGLADLLIGAYRADANGEESGASYVVFGRNPAQTGPFPPSLNLSSLDGTNGFRLNGVAAGDNSGISVSSAGDVNGDGLADLLIGAHRADPNGTYSGASYVVFGRNTAQTGPFPASLNLADLNGTNGFRLAGVAAYDNSGISVSSAGDVNADGFADLLIGAFRADPNGASSSGASYVVFGRNTAQTGLFPASLNPSSLDGTNGFRLAGVTADDLSGFAVSNAGDVNGDGLADLLIGAYRADPNGSSSGASYVVFGGPPPSPPPPPPPPPPSPPVEAALTNPAVAIPCTGSRCNVRISCNLAESSGTPCTNRIRLFVRAAAARLSGDGLAKAQRRIRFAFGIANVPPAQTATVKLRLTKKGKDILEKKRGKKLKGVLEIRNAPGTALTNTSIRIRLR